MTIKVKQVLNKVRELAHTRPEHVYYKMGMVDQCSYVGPGVGQPMEPDEGCIMGQAMMSSGVRAETLHDIETSIGAMSFGELIPNYNTHLEIESQDTSPGSIYREMLRFGDMVQRLQDDYMPWGEAYREAVRVHVVRRHEYQESHLPNKCDKCSLTKEAVYHQGPIQVGDIVMHAASKDIDPRTVVQSEDGMIWLDLPGTEPIGPFPAENYRVIDIDWEVVVDG